MKKKAVAAVVLLILCGVAILTNLNWWGVNPLQPVTVGDVVLAVQDESGRKTVADDSGMRLTGIEADGTVRYSLASSQKDDERGFYIIKNMAAGGDGSVYLLDKICEDGEWTAKEAVKKVSPDGKSIQVLYEKEYEDQVFSGNLLNLQDQNGVLYVMETSEDGLTAVDVTSPDQSAFFPYKDADQMFRKCLFGPDGDLTVILQTGQIVNIDREGTVKTLYDRSEETEKRIPWSFSYGPDGTMFRCV